MISERTKAALAAARARGVKLGGDRGVPLTPEARQAGCERRTAIADKRAAALAPTITELQADGAATLQAIADGLNRAGIPTATGAGEWQPVQVRRMLARV